MKCYWCEQPTQPVVGVPRVKTNKRPKLCNVCRGPFRPITNKPRKFKKKRKR